MATKVKKVKYKGFIIHVYPISWLCFLIGRDITTVRRWERRGILPEPLFKLQNNTRYYTAAEIRGYIACFKKAYIRHRIPIESTTFKSDCHKLKAFIVKSIENEKALRESFPEAEKTEKLIGLSKQRQWQKQAMRLIAG